MSQKHLTVIITPDGILSMDDDSVCHNVGKMIEDLKTILRRWHIPPPVTSRDSLLSALNSGSVIQLLVVILPETIIGRDGVVPKDKVYRFAHQLLTPEAYWPYLQKDAESVVLDHRVINYLRRPE